MTYHPKVRQLEDPVLSLAKDLVSLEDLASLRFDSGMDRKQIVEVMRSREALITQVRETLICERLKASEAVCKAIDQAVRRAEP